MNVKKYSEVELFQEMGLVNPSDRELGAKIYALQNEREGDEKMYKLYKDVFEHFFPVEGLEEEEDKEEVEGFEVRMPSSSVVSGRAAVAASTTATTTTNYPKGLLNLLLKETIKRTLCVDSQFRDTKVYPYSTNFTFNLSDTLVDVVSLKLHSVQIPYTWYTISNEFGSIFKRKCARNRQWIL